MIRRSGKIHFFTAMLTMVATYAASTLPIIAQSIPEDRENFHIYLLMGQSNMEGGQSVDGPLDTETHPRVLKLNNWNSWELAKDPITNNYETAVGPGLSFAKKLAAEKEDITIGLVPLAVGATPILDWSKGSVLYEQTLNAAAVARQKGVIKGILWHQGEHDAVYLHTMDAYPQRIRQLENDLRKDLQDVEIPFITAGFAKAYLDWPYRGQLVYRVWEYIKYNSIDTYLTGYVPTKDLPNMGDNLHFTTAGQRTLGERYTEEYLRVTDYYTQKAKEALLEELEESETTEDDESSTEEDGNSETETDENSDDIEEGWFYVENLGLIYYSNFEPHNIVKHAHLGWMQIFYQADGSIRMDSPIFGKLRTFVDGTENGVYLYRENPDIDELDVPGETFLVNFLDDIDADKTVYSHLTGEYTETIDGNPPLDSTEALYKMAESMYGKTAVSSENMIIGTTVSNWNDAKEHLDNTELNRIYTILYAQEAQQMAITEFEDNEGMRDFWIESAQKLLVGVDTLIEKTRIEYQNLIIQIQSGE